MTSMVPTTPKLWGVTTTIFAPTPAARRFCGTKFLPGVQTKLVAVGDQKTPHDAWHEFAKSSLQIVYLSPDKQLALPFSSVKLLPWNHFGRKNVGFLYALHKGAEWIFDFDDDNVLNSQVANMLPPVMLGAAPSYPMAETRHHLFNPYFHFQPQRESAAAGAAETAERVFIWPRGFPLDRIRDNRTYHLHATAAVEQQRVQVFQSLADHNPDVDAIYRMTRSLPVHFRRARTACAVPRGTFAPFNAQALLARSGAMWGLLLPVTVPGRVSDIWRSYLLQRLLWDTNASIAFTSSWVTQYRNPHSYMDDFESEADLYAKVCMCICIGMCMCGVCMCGVCMYSR